MNILLFPFGSAGDVHPLLGLGLALRARGHHVTMVANGYFRELIERTGLDFIEMMTGSQYVELTKHPDLWHPTRSFPYLFRVGVSQVMRPQYDLIMERYQPGNTVVVASCFGFGARAAQEKHGVPLVTVHLQPAVLWSEHDSPKLGQMLNGPGVPRWLKRLQYWMGETFILDWAARPAVNQFLASVGLPPMRRISRWWHSRDRVLGMFPDWFAPIQPDWPQQTRLSEFPLWDEGTVSPPQPELEAFLQAGEPPLVFTPGSGNSQGAEFFKAAADACARLGRRGLLLTRFKDQIPATLPTGVRHFEYAPFGSLLPRAAAIVHHGGVGTLSQGFRAGIPQLLMPMAHDQPDNAMRTQRLGVGDFLDPAKFRGPQVAAKLAPLLASREVQERCATVAQRFVGVDPFARACDVVEESATLRQSVMKH